VVAAETDTPPAVVEQPLVVGVVDPGHHPGNLELPLGEQSDHQVALVVPGHRDHGVGMQHPASSRTWGWHG